jgi:hypothetical protein
MSVAATSAAMSIPIAKQIPCAPPADRRVDADDLTRAVDERAAGVAGIQRRVGLNHAFHEPARARAQTAAERADDAGGHGRLVAEWIADRDHELPDAQRRGAAERRVGEAAAGEPQHSDVSLRIVADQRGRHFAAVGQRGAQLGRAVGDVTVRQQIAVRCVEHAGADAARPAARANRDTHDSRAHAVERLCDDIRIGIESVKHAGIFAPPVGDSTRLFARVRGPGQLPDG